MFPFCSFPLQNILRRKAATFEQLEKIRVPDWNFISTTLPCFRIHWIHSKQQLDAESARNIQKLHHLAHPPWGLMSSQYMLCWPVTVDYGATCHFGFGIRQKFDTALSMDIPTNLQRNSQLKEYGPASDSHGKISPWIWELCQPKMIETIP